MDRYERTEDVDTIFTSLWKVFHQTPDSVPLALQATSTQVGPRMPPGYVPPPQRTAPAGAPLSDKRKDMLAIITKWFNTSLSNPRVPPGEAKDLPGDGRLDKGEGRGVKDGQGCWGAPGNELR